MFLARSWKERPLKVPTLPCCEIRGSPRARQPATTTPPPAVEPRSFGVAQHSDPRQSAHIAHPHYHLPQLLYLWVLLNLQSLGVVLKRNWPSKMGATHPTLFKVLPNPRLQCAGRVELQAHESSPLATTSSRHPSLHLLQVETMGPVCAYLNISFSPCSALI